MRYLPRSMLGQFLLAQILILLVAGITLPLAMSSMLHHTADAFVRKRFDHDANRLARLIRQDAQKWTIDLHNGMGPFYTPQEGTRSFAVVDAKGILIGQSPRPFDADIAQIPRTSQKIDLRLGPLDVASIPKRFGKTTLWFLIAQDRRRPEVIVDDVVASFLARFLWIVPVTIVVSLGLAIFVVRRAAGKIGDVSREADGIRADTMDLRLNAEQLPSEARPLANAVNHALDRVHDAYRNQSEFIANVAHELRTPLALIALRTETCGDPLLKMQLHGAVERATHVINQLMELASVENPRPNDDPADLCAVARHAVEMHAPLVFRSGRTIALDAPPLPHLVAGSTALIEIALSNLIDNAIRHTPEGTDIIVTILDNGGIAVADNGPGIAASPGDARRRYWRADMKRTDSAGLGLAIVDRIMTALGGQLKVGSRADGGALMQLQFRASPAEV